jgi:DNA-binding PadR family transcriptional regulator
MRHRHWHDRFNHQPEHHQPDQSQGHEPEHDRCDPADDWRGARDRGEMNFGMGRGRGAGFGPGRGGPRARRGDIRLALLTALGDGPAHGYELIQRLEERSGGRWKPSPGSVYPTLQMLEDADLVRSSQRDDKRVYEITEAGQTELAKRVEETGGPAWFTDSEGAGGHHAFRHSIGQLVMAAKQVGMAGNSATLASATEIINDARRKLYQLLSEA